MKKTLIIPLLFVLGITFILSTSPYCSLIENPEGYEYTSLKQLNELVYQSFKKGDYQKIDKILFKWQDGKELSEDLMENAANGKNEIINTLKNISYQAEADTLSHFQQITDKVESKGVIWNNFEFADIQYRFLSAYNIEGASLLITASTNSPATVKIKLDCIKTSRGWLLARLNEVI